MQDVRPKVIVLNQLCSTRILSIHLEVLARHIVNLRIDALLAEGEPGVGNLIKKCDGLPRYFSFASKYYSWHKPTAYPIYDSYAEECLWQYKKQRKFLEYNRYSYDYAGYMRIVTAFRKFYGLTRFTFKELDKFLYVMGGHLKGEFVFAALAEGRLGTEASVSTEPSRAL